MRRDPRCDQGLGGNGPVGRLECGHVDRTSRSCRIGDHGLGIAEVAARAAHRGPAQPQPVGADAMVAVSRNPSTAVERASAPSLSATSPLAGERHHDLADLRTATWSSSRWSRIWRSRSTSSPNLTEPAGRPPSWLEHVDAPRRRAGHGDRPARQGVRDHFFNPPGHDAGRDRAAITPRPSDGRRPCLAETCGKEPVEVKDQAGFIVNACCSHLTTRSPPRAGVASKEGIDAA